MIVPFVPTFEGNFAASHVDYRRVLFQGGYQLHPADPAFTPKTADDPAILA